MRLLELLPNGDLRLTKKFLDDAVPRYAILSHRWEEDAQELTFEDVIDGLGRGKAGYQKVKFCGEQAIRDGLHYFWVDSCCIKKSNDAELSESLNSMFRWYHRAEKCYVYLSDVPSKKRKRGEDNAWEQTFRASEWFTRGWTLQELLAPDSVEFFSRDKELLGDKRSLERMIHEITGIPISALRGTALPHFSTEEKFAWASNRRTTREEDWAYSLLGVFEISMPVIYGEGRVQAVRRLRKEIADDDLKSKECLRHLYVTDPRADKIRIEGIKGGLLADSYRWVLDNHDFKRWRDEQEDNSLLWIKGDPGKGKTMLLCGIIDELKHSITGISSYFFCQETDKRINSSTAVLRGLLTMLIDQQPSLISHVQKRYDQAGKTLFEDVNAWVALTDIFTNVLLDPSLKRTYLIIDALDECIVGLPNLLDFITQKSSLSPHVKWLVSSRNWAIIEECLGKADSNVRLCLELNSESISAAVSTYIQYNVDQLAFQKKYDDETRNAVSHYLSSNANNTFLWVALACQNLQKIKPWSVLAKLNEFPPGLDSLYGRMMKQIDNSDDADLCKRILASMATVYRPVTLKELTSIVTMPESLSQNPDWLAEIIGQCGSFLAVGEHFVYFVHQSAKDYLITHALAAVFPSGKDAVHYEIYSQSIQAMQKRLRRDMYDLRVSGYSRKHAKPPDLNPLASIAYSCFHWVDHLCEWESHNAVDHRHDLQDTGTVYKFIKSKYLYWLEAVSLMNGMPVAVLAIAKLEKLIQDRVDAPMLLELVYDARRFIMHNKQAVEMSPLQVYVSALIFSPRGSLIRRYFSHEEPKWITMKTPIEDQWNACLQTLEGHQDHVQSVAFSHDASRIISGSWDKTVKIWDAGSGECIATLEGHNYDVRAVAFSNDSSRIISASRDKTVKIWDAGSGECVATLEGHNASVVSVAFSHDSSQIISASWDDTIKIWSAQNGECIATLKAHTKDTRSVAFSHDLSCFASAAIDNSVKIWSVSSGGKCIKTLNGHTDKVRSIAFSHDSSRLASASKDHSVRIWDVNSGKCHQTLQGHTEEVVSASFSSDSKGLVSTSLDKTIRLWNIEVGAALQIITTGIDVIRAIKFSPDGKQLASASADHSIRLWNIESAAELQRMTAHEGSVNRIVFSTDTKHLVSTSSDRTIKLWDIQAGEVLRTLKGHKGGVLSARFSPDGKRLVSASSDGTAKLWDVESGEVLRTLEGHNMQVFSVDVSPDGKQIVSSSSHQMIKLWDAESGAALQTFIGHQGTVFSAVFSPDGKRIASSATDRTIKQWDIKLGAVVRTHYGHRAPVTCVAFSHSSARLASVSLDETVRIWDASSDNCVQTFNIGTVPSSISFDLTDMYLHTDLGAMILDEPPVDIADIQIPRYRGVSLSSDRMWIMYNSEKLIRIPPAYRAESSAVSGKTIGIGASGRVWICSFEDTNF